LPAGDPKRRGLEAVRDAGATRPVTDARVPIAPGVTAGHSPWHTLAYTLRAGAAEQEGVLSGDAVRHPLQLNDQGIGFLPDAERQEALTTREQFLGELAGGGAAVGANHFPGLRFRRVARTEPRSWQEI